MKLHSQRCLKFASRLFLTPLLVFCFAMPLFAQSETKETRKTKEEIKDTKQANAKDILTNSTPDKKLYTLRKIRFIDEATENFKGDVDTNLAFERALDEAMPFFLDKEGLKAFQPGPGTQDRVGEEWQRQHVDIPPTISLNEAVRSLLQTLNKPRKENARDLPVPSDTEIDILKILWVEKEATASDIYSKLDTSQVIFAEELRSILGQMVDRGFVDRKQISGSNEFSLFGIAQIELSSKNRKNKEYLYWPIVTKEHLFTYLDAKRFLALAARNENDYDLKNNDYAGNYQKVLESKLYRLFE